MSRTYRRKGMSHHELPCWITHDWDTIDGIWKQVPYKGKELKEVLSKQYTDLGYKVYGNDVPKYFRQDLNRGYRLRMNRETRRILREADYEGYQFDPQRDTAAWDWW